MYRNIYILAPYKTATGGVELAHQLVDYLRNNKFNAYIIYMSGLNISTKQDITNEYLKYNIKTTNKIEDDSENILILPEIYFEYVLKYKNIQIGCWWMSVDNHYKQNICFKDAFGFEKNIISKLRILGSFVLGRGYQYKNSNKLLKKEENRITHYYQSHYAQYHLYKIGFSKIKPLTDYINTDFIDNHILNKENIVLYNPSKGYEFTKKIINNLKGFTFIPLKGLTRAELKILMQRAKIYIDFGHFPGKDRLFREAVLNNCCILTGKLGASYFYEDVPISEEYKFETSNRNINHICSKIKYVLDNYNECNKDFNYLRKKTLQEKEQFYKEIDDIFGINKQ